MAPKVKPANWASWGLSAQALGQMGKRPATKPSEAASGKLGKRTTTAEATAKSQCVAVSVKVASLRAAGYPDFETWLQDEGNLYVGRRGRIFIHDGSSKRIFHFPSSQWQNPFAVSKTTSRQMACEKFRRALLDGSLKDGDALANGDGGFTKSKTHVCFCHFWRANIGNRQSLRPMFYLNIFQ